MMAAPWVAPIIVSNGPRHIPGQRGYSEMMTTVMDLPDGESVRR
jgi:hypothetical protein